MTRKTARKLILALIQELDYDLYKHFLPECSEISEEEIEEELETLIDIVKKYD
jgi:hypothetical protein